MGEFAAIGKIKSNLIAKSERTNDEGFHNPAQDYLKRIDNQCNLLLLHIQARTIQRPPLLAFDYTILSKLFAKDILTKTSTSGWVRCGWVLIVTLFNGCNVIRKFQYFHYGFVLDINSVRSLIIVPALLVVAIVVANLIDRIDKIIGRFEEVACTYNRVGVRAGCVDYPTSFD